MKFQSFLNRLERLVLSAGMPLAFVVIASFNVLADGPPYIGNKWHDDTSPIPLYMPNQLVVKFAPTGDPASLLGTNLNGGTVAFQLSSGAFLIEFDPGTDIGSEALNLSQLSGVEYAHPNYLFNSVHPVQGSIPVSDQAGTGDYRNQPPSEMLNVNDAHLMATGAGVTVGLLDGGVDYTHASLSGHIVSAFDFIDDDNDPFDEPGGRASGHGTFVAGVIQLGAPDATIRAYRIFHPTGFGDGFTLARAIEQAASDGCDVISISVVLVHEHEAVNDAIDRAIEQGVVVVAAAGNEGTSDPIYPAAYPPVIAVGAIDTSMVLSDFSSFGSQIDVCAPGEEIYSTFKENGFAWWSGTSFAAPFVAAQAALLRQRRAGATHAEVAHSLIQTSASLDILNPDRVGEMGAGLIDMAASIDFIDTLPTASVTPDTLFFEAVAGVDYFVPFFANVALLSSNAPAAYTTEILPGDQSFSWVGTPTGMTNVDSLTIHADPIFRDVGVHYNTILFHVDGVVEPVELTVVMEVQLPENQVWLSPDWINVQAQFGTEPIIQRQVTVSSFNAPAGYSVVIPPSLSGLLEVDKTSGNTNDLVTFLIIPANALSSGFYHDTVLFWVGGITQPGVLPVSIDIVDTTVSPGASITPSTMRFVDTSSPIGILNQTALLTSINAPAPYTIVVNSSAQQYLQVHSSDSLSGGVTDDLIDVIIIKSFLPGPGIYEDTVKFFVDSIVDPAVLLITTEVGDGGGGQDSAFVTPLSHTFSALEGTDSTQFGSIYVGTPLLGSVPYVVTVLDAQDIVFIPDSVGMSNDSLQFEVHSNASMAPGLYEDTLVFFIDGVPNPLISVVYLTIVTDSGGGGLVTATASPAAQGFSAVDGIATVMTGNLFVSSDNAPSPFTVSLVDSATAFTTLLTTSGMTDDSIFFEVNVLADMPVGVYVDTILVTVDGAFVNAGRNPIIILQIDSTAGGGGLVSATVSPAAQGFAAVEGTATVMTGSLFVSSDNAPSQFTVSLVDSASAFTTLLTTSGMTNDAIQFEINVTAEMPAGIYVDTVRVQVDGAFVNAGRDPIIILQIDSTGGGVLPIATVTPSNQQFTVVEGSGSAITGTVTISSTNAPAEFTVVLLDSISAFTSLITTSGMTHDSIRFDISGAALLVGSYADTLLISVAGVDNSPVIAVLNLKVVTNGNGGSDSAWVSPLWLTLGADAGDTSPVTACAIVQSSNALVSYTAILVSSPGGSFVSIPSTGMTGDSLCVSADPTSLAPGVYVDTIAINVNGVSNPVSLIVLLNVTQPVPAMTLTNFPNPFNPSTQIRFTLPKLQTVRLSVYNILGQEIERLVDETLPAGQHTVTWNSGSRSSGIYFYRLETNTEAITRKMMLLK